MRSSRNGLGTYILAPHWKTAHDWPVHGWHADGSVLAGSNPSRQLPCASQIPWTAWHVAPDPLAHVSQ